MTEWMSKPWESPSCPQPLTGHRPHLYEVCAADSSLGSTSYFLVHDLELRTTPLQGYWENWPKWQFSKFSEESAYCVCLWLHVVLLLPTYRFLVFFCSFVCLFFVFKQEHKLMTASYMTLRLPNNERLFCHFSAFSITTGIWASLKTRPKCERNHLHYVRPYVCCYSCLVKATLSSLKSWSPNLTAIWRTLKSNKEWSWDYHIHSILDPKHHISQETPNIGTETQSPAFLSWSMPSKKIETWDMLKPWTPSKTAEITGIWSKVRSFY